MNLQFVTCSGANEHTDIPELVKLLDDYPLAEVGIQVSNERCSYGSPRFEWIQNLVNYVNCAGLLINAALHVNLKWVEAFSTGVIVPELSDLLNYRDVNGEYFFKRIQLNFKIGRETTAPDKEKLTELIRYLKGRAIILSYSLSNASLIRQLYRDGVAFNCLYDESFGRGIAPETRQIPVFCDIVQGYAGGISPDNVVSVLDTIQNVWSHYPTATGIYIDAQGKLEDENKHFDLNKARRYVENAHGWKMAHCYDDDFRL